jgi:hypothetical protein
MNDEVRRTADTLKTADTAVPARVKAACLVSLAIGLFFLFVRAPHPWGWNGFDHYHELALALASGRPFPTMEVPWGYAYFLSAFYRVFGDRPWIPLIVQVTLNAATPILLFALARRWTSDTTAALAAVLLGAFSFNTVYASTQSSDAICTVLFLSAILVFVRALEQDKRSGFALAGLIAGVMSQFRPNLILIPGLLAAYAIWTSASARATARRAVVHAIVLLLCAAATLAPWVVRNYRLTKTIVPTSVHGGAQLWYGTLQSGRYLDSRGYNPRSIFESPAFDYTSLSAVPIVISGGVMTCAIEAQHGTLTLFYWTDFDPVKKRLAPSTLNRTTGRFTFELPAPDGDTATYYYYFEAAWDVTAVDTPASGAQAPYVYFVSQDHLGDMDRYHDLLDIFDVIRLARHEAWGEPLAAADLLARAGVPDVQSAVARLIDMPAHLEHDDETALMTIGHGSSITIPRIWRGRITDLTLAGPSAEALMYARASLAALSRPTPVIAKADAACGLVGEVKVNDVFYRREPEAMRRYSALAFDNIRREPFAFVKAALYRAYRVFVVVGTSDKWTNQQFAGAGFVYAAATAASLTFLGLFVAGVVILWRRAADIVLPLALILYVPVTIAPLLTNMRYSVTVQPLMFVFAAAALRAIRDRAGTRTAPRT